MAGVCKLLIADDQMIFRECLSAILEVQPDLVVVGQAADGLEALQKARTLHPDVILMDLEMPICGGLEATALITRELPETRVMILTFHADEPDLVYRAITAGAVGYVVKTTGIEDLVASIKAVARGEAAVATPALTSLVSFLNRAITQPGSQAAPVEKLTAREQEVLELVAEGFSNREIADRLCISENTVHSHLGNVLGKLHLANRVQAAALVARTRAEPSQKWRRTSSTQPDDGEALPVGGHSRTMP
jgi:DNA-binding NarL/FixJ family response regulator